MNNCIIKSKEVGFTTYDKEGKEDKAKEGKRHGQLQNPSENVWKVSYPGWGKEFFAASIRANFEDSIVFIAFGVHFQLPSLFTMDPCPFVRLIGESLALKLSQATKPAGANVYPTATPCFCKLRLKNFPSQTALFPLSNGAGDSPRIVHLRIRLPSRCTDDTQSLREALDALRRSLHRPHRPVVFQDGWMKVGNDSNKSTAKLHLMVRAKPDPQFVFQFGIEPECSPVVFQIQGNIRQPVFSCKFSADSSGYRSLPPDFSNKNREWKKYAHRPHGVARSS
ncbi:putative Derlin-3 [Hibiscus syriacus]|uniref:Derlin-3 n=1 Tax=Hibiscus syriacus TaxID=106335 RepID=A0A6A3C1R8_HIBSY|nr:putative Derlin-3 [Hibiscus syriacus]